MSTNTFTRLSKQVIVWLLTATCILPIATQRQYVRPIVRFHTENTPYMRYYDNLLSGYLQTAAENDENGFLQLPFTGRPLLVYIGEKDSTQFMAYATGFKAVPAEGNTEAATWLSRYGVTARIERLNDRIVHHYTFPDTTAEKGFLIDIDNAACGASNEDMDFKLVDHHSIRAYKRSYDAGATKPELYYYAHFSHPYESYNVRRERITLENGKKESRLKAAFTFLLKPGEELTVTSAVSAESTDAAYAMVEGHRPTRHLSDVRKPRPAEPNENLLAQNGKSTSSGSKQGPTASAGQNIRHTTRSKAQKSSKKDSARQPDTKHIETSPRTLADNIIVETREATLRAAFYAAIDYLTQQPELKGVTDAAVFMDKLNTLCPAADTLQTVEETDSILRITANAVIAGVNATSAEKTTRAASFVLNSIGLQPIGNNAYQLHRPAFNVVTLYLPRDRRFILHAKSNSPRNCHVQNATLNGVKQTLPLTLTHEQLLKGGVVAVKMMN